MALSARRRRYVRRLAGYATNPVARRARRLVRQDQRLEVAGHEILLPPEHDLPFYQRRDPTYDTYAVDVLSGLAEGVDRMLVVDIGANVGDTAVAALGAASVIEVVAVEGDPEFVSYLRRNTAEFGDRCRVVDAFVGPVDRATVYSRTGTTGGFQAQGHDPLEVTRWVSPAELLVGADEYDLVVWKSDIDGLDIHVLAEHWDVVDAATDMVWFEFDPASTLGDREDIPRLIDALAASGRDVRVYDNLGRPMVDLPGGPAVATGLRGLAEWLRQQRGGHVTVPYLDVWAQRAPRLA